MEGRTYDSSRVRDEWAVMGSCKALDRLMSWARQPSHSTASREYYTLMSYSESYQERTGGVLTRFSLRCRTCGFSWQQGAPIMNPARVCREFWLLQAPLRVTFLVANDPQSRNHAYEV